MARVKATNKCRYLVLRIHGKIMIQFFFLGVFLGVRVGRERGAILHDQEFFIKVFLRNEDGRASQLQNNLK